MPFSSAELIGIETPLGTFCREYIPAHMRRRLKITYEINGYNVRILERRLCSTHIALWLVNSIAKFHYSPDSRAWELYRVSSTGKWVKASDSEPTPDLQSLIDTVAEDDIGFLGYEKTLNGRIG